MNKITTFLAILWLLVGCGNEQATPPNKQPSTSIAKTVSQAEFAALIKQEGIILDVRRPQELAKGKIENSINIDYLEDDFAEKANKLDKETPIYVYCASGGRSEEAMHIMQQLGFTEIYNLDGGYHSWEKAQ